MAPNQLVTTGIRVRVFVNDPEDRDSILGWVIPKIQKTVLDASLFNTRHYKTPIKGKWSNPGKGVLPFLTSVK